VWDYFAAGGTRDALLGYVAAAPEWNPDATTRRRAQRRAELQRERRRLRRARHPEKQARTRSEVASRAALESVRTELRSRGQPRSGRQIKAALQGRHARDVVDAAVKAGVADGSLEFEQGPHNARLYRLSQAALTYAGFTGPDTPHRLSRMGPDTEPLAFPKQTPVSECPEAVKPEAAVHASITLKENLSSTTRHTPSSLSRHSPDMQRLNNARTLNGDGAAVESSHDRDTNLAAASRADLQAAASGAELTAQQRDVERAQDIERDHCCGRDGSQLRCRLCRWSRRYYRLEAPA
jgi:hypothetical protein